MVYSCTLNVGSRELKVGKLVGKYLFKDGIILRAVGNWTKNREMSPREAQKDGKYIDFDLKKKYCVKFDKIPIGI